ncbi:MAG: hypothetical protein KBT70_13655 [Roseovarius sp.]|uniref:hypothetical protein n=1 Tax=Roseovarius sp. TaxID=1486281 RepID=UPI001B4C306C|nr:hypothetical protein [Roseovarius sp.]MBQ0751233.1 hypothetical protein [Roseovarius sp.]MBQ0808638.1 hypothetical protein [Roseovarius sp.]
MKTGVFALPVTALVLLTATFALADASEEDTRAECRSTGSCTIKYDHLATEKSDPYKVYGNPPIKHADRWAAARFDDVRDCLLPAEKRNDAPDLTQIDWRKMRSKAVIEVCLFRIFSSLGNPMAAKRWFEVQGLRRVKLYTSSGRAVRDGRQVEVATTSVKAGNLLSETEKCYVSRNFSSNFLCSKVVHAETFSASWNEDGQLWGTAYGQTSK